MSDPVESKSVVGGGGVPLAPIDRFRSMSLRKQLLIGGALLLFLVGLGAGLWQFYVVNSRTTVTEKTPFQQAQDMKDKGDYTEAAQYAAKQYNSSKSANDKYMLAQQAGSSYESQKNCPLAIEWYKKAATLKQKDAASAAGQARCYDAMGDKKQAVVYYQQTLDWYDRSLEVNVQNDIPMYTKLLENAKAAQ